MKQSVNMYKATKLWQPNRYMQQLVTDGTIYFLAYIYALLITGVVSNIVVITMTPQFIISLRELYDQDLRGRWEGIDTGFGVLSRPAASTNAAMSAIAFANTSSVQGESQVVEVDIEVNRLEVLGDGTRQV
ncbi:hypothetical protein V8E55_009716 [Tylopilus felleus]